MGNQLTAVVSVNLSDVSSQYELIGSLGDPGRSYASSFHCRDWAAVRTRTTATTGTSVSTIATSLSAQPDEHGSWLEDVRVATTRDVCLDRQRRRRHAINFRKHVQRQFGGGSGPQRDGTAAPLNLVTTNATGTAPAMAARTSSFDDGTSSFASRSYNSTPAPASGHTVDVASGQPALHGAFAEHYQQYRELFLHRGELNITGGAAAAAARLDASVRAGLPAQRSFLTLDQQMLQRTDVPVAVRQLIAATTADTISTSVMMSGNSGVTGGAAPYATGGGLDGTGAQFRSPASTAVSAPVGPAQDVVVKVFVTTEGDAQQQRQMTAIKDMMLGVGEQLNAIEATRHVAPATGHDTTRQRDGGIAVEAEQDGVTSEGSRMPVSSPSSSPASLSHLIGLSEGTCLSSSVLYYTRVHYQDRGRFGLLQRPFIAFSLPERLQTRPYWGKSERLFACYQLVRALQELHDTYGVVHGDVKPNNVLVQTNGWLYLSDLALYKPTFVPANDPAMFGYYYDTEDTRVCYLAPEKFVDVQGWGGVRRSAGEDGATTTAAAAAGTTSSSPTPAAAAGGGGERRAGSAELFPEAGDVMSGGSNNNGFNDNLGAGSGREGLLWSVGGANVHKHTVAMDVFSAGCVMAYIMTGEHLLHLSETLELRGLATESARTALVQGLLADRGLTDEDMVQLLCRVLCSTPAERPTARQLLEAFTPRVFPLWFTDMYDAVLPALLSQAPDVQLRWLQSQACEETVNWCVKRVVAPSHNDRRTATHTDPHRQAAGWLSRLLLPIALSAIQTAASDDATLLGITCLKHWFVPRVSLSAVLDAILPCALYVANGTATYTATTRVMALRVLMDIGLRTLAEEEEEDKVGDDEYEEDVRTDEKANVASSQHMSSSTALPGSRHHHRHHPPHSSHRDRTHHSASSHNALHDDDIPLSVTREGLFRDVLMPCFAEIVGLASVEPEAVLIDVARALPTLLLCCRYSLESSLKSEPTRQTPDKETDTSGKRHTRHTSNRGASFSSTLQDLLSTGWELLQGLYKHSTSISVTVVATLLAETPRVVAFLGEDRVHRDLIPLLTTLIASPPAVLRLLYPESVRLHALLETPRPETLHLFVSEGLRQSDTLCLVRTLEAMQMVLKVQSRVLPVSEMMSCVHQAIPLLLSPSELVFRATTALVAMTARLYRPAEVTVYLEAAVRPLLARRDLPIAELDAAPRSAIRADLLSLPSPQLSDVLSPHAADHSEGSRAFTLQDGSGGLGGGAGGATSFSSFSSDTTAQLSDEERALLLEHMQLGRVFTEANAAMDLAGSTPPLFVPLNPLALMRTPPASASRFNNNNNSIIIDNNSISSAAYGDARGAFVSSSSRLALTRGAGSDAAAAATFDEVCRAVLLVPPTAAARTGSFYASLLTRFRGFIEPDRRSAPLLPRDARTNDSVKLVAARHTERGSEDGARATTPTPESRPRSDPNSHSEPMPLDSGTLYTSASLCGCTARPLRPIAIALASASVHMGGIYSVTALASTPEGRQVLLSAGAREEALVWGLDVESQGIHGNLEVLCRVPRLPLPSSLSSPSSSSATPTYLVSQRLAVNDGAATTSAASACSVVLGASDGVVRYYDAEQTQFSGYGFLSASRSCAAPSAAAVTALDVYSPHVFFAGTADGLLALVDTRAPTSTTAGAAHLAWSTHLDAADGAISSLCALHYGNLSYAVVAATYGGFASLFDLRYPRLVAHYSVGAGMTDCGARSRTRGGAMRPSVLATCADPCSFAHALKARFAHPGPALLLGTSDGDTYRLQLRTGELSLAFQIASGAAESPGPAQSGLSHSHAIRAMLCQPAFGCVVTGSEDGVLRRWQVPSSRSTAAASVQASSASSSPPNVEAFSRASGAIACPPVMRAAPCESFRAPRTLVSSTPGLLLDECSALWPEVAAAAGSGAGVGSAATLTSSRLRHRVPDSTDPLFPTVSLRERCESGAVVLGQDPNSTTTTTVMAANTLAASLPAPHHHRDAVLSIAALWGATPYARRATMSSFGANAGPFLVSGSRDGTLSIWQNEGVGG